MLCTAASQQGLPEFELELLLLNIHIGFLWTGIFLLLPLNKALASDLVSRQPHNCGYQKLLYKGGQVQNIMYKLFPMYDFTKNDLSSRDQILVCFWTLIVRLCVCSCSLFYIQFIMLKIYAVFSLWF